MAPPFGSEMLVFTNGFLAFWIISVSPSGPARRPAGLDLGLGRGLRPSLRDGANDVLFCSEVLA